MKKVLIAALVVVLLYPVVPWVLGRTIEQRVGEYTDQLQRQLPYVSIVQTRFTRGWYSSEQDITIGGATPALGLAGASLTIHNVIHHGPVCGLTCIGLARVETHIEFAPATQASIVSLFGKAEPVAIETRLHLLGGITTTVTSPPLPDVALDDGTHLASSGGSFSIDQGAHGDRLAMHGNLTHLSVHERGALRVELSGAAFESHAERLLRSLYVGDGALTLAKFSLEGLPQGALSVTDLHVTSKTSAEAGFVTVAIQFGTGQIATKPLTLASTDFDFSYGHMNADALESLTAGLVAVNHDATIPPAEHGEKLAAVLRDKAPALLQQDPVFTVDRIRLRNAAGALLVTGSLRLPGFVAADLRSDDSPKALLQKLKVAFDLAVDQPFLASLPNGEALTAQLQAFVRQGLASVDHGQFQSKLVYADGKATFNGQVLPTAPTAAPVPAASAARARTP